MEKKVEKSAEPGSRRYPSLRETFLLPDPFDWLLMKADVDKLVAPPGHSGPVWRIDNSLYDLSKFDHPGGNEFLSLTKNTDITELFESSHPNMEKVRCWLSKYKIGDCADERNSSFFTFHPSGFYCTLRQRAYNLLKAKPVSLVPYWSSTAIIHDVFLSIHMALLAKAIIIPSFDVECIICLISAGAVLAFLAMAAHNYFHKKDNWRMLSFDLMLHSSREWRISHAYSHHVFPNSLMDYEVMAFEPFLCYLPDPSKARIDRIFLTMLFILVVFPSSTLTVFLKRTSKLVTGKLAMHWTYFVPYFLILASISLRLCMLSEPLFIALKATLARLVVMHMACASVFLHVSLAAGHHHPNVWHAGDPLPEVTKSKATDGKTSASNDHGMDWGVFQLLTIGRRPDVDSIFVLSTISFGQHILHHLFPTVDQCQLVDLEPLLIETTKEFGLYDLIAPTGRGSMTPIGGYLGMFYQAFRSVSRSENFPLFALERGKAKMTLAGTKELRHVN